MLGFRAEDAAHWSETLGSCHNKETAALMLPGLKIGK